MAFTYTWTVQSLSCLPQEDGQQDVVYIVYWRCEATDGVFSAFNTGQTTIPYTPGQPFTPYADLTQDQVLGWVWSNGVDKDATEAALAQNINDQINPPVVTPPLPWA